MPSKVPDEVTYISFLNCNGSTVEVKEWISNFIPHFFIGCSDLSMVGWKLKHVGKRGNWWIARVMDWSSSFNHKAAQVYTYMHTYLYKLTQYENIYHSKKCTWSFWNHPNRTVEKQKKSKSYYLQQIIETEPAFNSKLNIFLVMMRHRKNVYLSYHHYMIFRITTGARHLVSLLDHLFD